MAELTFTVEEARGVPHCLLPTLGFRVRVEAAAGAAIEGILLDCQLRIEAQLRRYQKGEAERLWDLFDRPSEWSRTLRSLLWTHLAANIPAFQEETAFELQVPCTFDFDVAAVKYFRALESGEVPLLFLFSGSVFSTGPGGALQLERIPWTKEAAFRLSIGVWQELMDGYYPNTAWLELRRDVVERLARFRSDRALPTWEQALESLLPAPQASPGARPGEGGQGL